MKTVITTLILLLTTCIASATTYIVPLEQPNIQAAIDIAVSGDSIQVEQGTYSGYGFRDIDFHGKAIVLQSISGPETTILDLQADSLNRHRAFWFQRVEDNLTVIDGFTITGGYAPLGNNSSFGPLPVYSFGGGAGFGGTISFDPNPIVFRPTVTMDNVRFVIKSYQTLIN